MDPHGQPSRGDDTRDQGPAEGDGLLADGADAETEPESGDTDGDGDEPGLPPAGDDPMEGAAPSG
ncbi:MAG TPA: hypothetical protein VEW93_07860 [Acidimicrobiales bacterium]|nr:hypothetical protein [Acidimicrobiales bacterium]